MFDIISYILGKKAGTGTVELESTNYTCTDDGNGNITIQEGGDE